QQQMQSDAMSATVMSALWRRQNGTVPEINRHPAFVSSRSRPRSQEASKTGSPFI
ncbi:hypothetical protein E4U54_005482, partial [Claviceps lovelessii]